MNRLFLRASLIWLGLCAVAFFNGAVRELGMKNGLGIGDPAAHRISCLTAAILWTAFTALSWKALPIRTFRQAIQVGIGWFVATMLFETFVLNRNLSWEQILQTYNVAAGELWLLDLLWIGLLPVLLYIVKSPASHTETESPSGSR